MSLESWDMENNVYEFLLQIFVRKTTASLCNIFDLDLSFLPSVTIKLYNFKSENLFTFTNIFRLPVLYQLMLYF